MRGDTVARLGGDEFVVLLEPLDEQAAAVRVADRLVAAVSRRCCWPAAAPFGSGPASASPSARTPDIDPEALLHEADVAVYRAKSTGRGHTEVFDRRTAARARRSAPAGGRRSRRAIEHDELVVHYQPIIQVATRGRRGLRGAGALEPAGVGLLMPADFIPVAEQSDLICALDTWVLHRATARNWPAGTPGSGPAS